ncbi:hypothetical protein GDO86_019133, partial [Hymenochirus boettgeri]
PATAPASPAIWSCGQPRPSRETLLSSGVLARPPYWKLERVHSCVQALLRDEQQPQLWEQLGQIYESEQDGRTQYDVYQTAARYHGGYELNAHISRLQQGPTVHIHGAPLIAPKSLPHLQQVWDLCNMSRRRHFAGKKGLPQLKRPGPHQNLPQSSRVPTFPMVVRAAMKRRRSGSPNRNRDLLLMHRLSHPMALNASSSPPPATSPAAPPSSDLSEARGQGYLPKSSLQLRPPPCAL